MKLPELTPNFSSEAAAQILSDAARQLNASEKGAAALRALASISDDLVSLDENNQNALLLLVRGVFSHPGTGREVIKAAVK